MLKIKLKSIEQLMQDSFYDQIDPRRRQEIHDSRMISEDHTAIANLSPKFINRQFNQHTFKHDSLSAGDPDMGSSEVE